MINCRPHLLYLHCYCQQGTLKNQHTNLSYCKELDIVKAPGVVVWSLSEHCTVMVGVGKAQRYSVLAMIKLLYKSEGK